jgi:uncharacterized membrane protein
MFVSPPRMFAFPPDLPAPEHSPSSIAVSLSEKPWRSFAKAVSWRAAGSLDTTLLAFLFTNSMVIATTIGSAEVITKTALYYLHERVWTRVGIGVEGRS